ncbi:uncharacterized protein PWA37_003154 [Arxiozyma heterogenica]|uniref:uncharacterized protein n=1 Tax=Arxiozyma heterogenica TaxID=278026 RepID=UPI002F1CC702
MKEGNWLLKASFILFTICKLTKAVYNDSVIDLCMGKEDCIHMLLGNSKYESCNTSFTFPCTNENGNIIVGSGVYSPSQLRPRVNGAWWGLLSSTLGSASDAVDKWKTFVDDCVDTEGESGTYSGGACARSAISAILMTAAVVVGVGTLVATILKRDTQVGRALLYASGPFNLVANEHTQFYKRDDSLTYKNMTVELNGTPIFSIDAHKTDSSVSLFLTHFGANTKRDLEKRDEDIHGIFDGYYGLKYNACHPDYHKLTSRYDWDAMWNRVDQNAGNIMSHYYSDLGIVDMNDKVPGNWQQLVSTGKLILEQERTFGHNFEGCDPDAFSQLARFS